MSKRAARVLPTVCAQSIIRREGAEREGGWILPPQNTRAALRDRRLFVEEDDVALGCNPSSDPAKREVKRKRGFELVCPSRYLARTIRAETRPEQNRCACSASHPTLQQNGVLAIEQALVASRAASSGPI